MRKVFRYQSDEKSDSLTKERQEANKNSEDHSYREGFSVNAHKKLPSYVWKVVTPRARMKK